MLLLEIVYYRTETTLKMISCLVTYSESSLNPLFKTESTIYKWRRETCYSRKVI